VNPLKHGIFLLFALYDRCDMGEKCLLNKGPTVGGSTVLSEVFWWVTK
jgi:hypothetical protein